MKEHDPNKKNEEQGLYKKYHVARGDGKPLGPCFVMEPVRDPYALVALRAYADAIESTHPQLAAEMRVEYEL